MIIAQCSNVFGKKIVRIPKKFVVLVLVIIAVDKYILISLNSNVYN